MKKKLIVVDTLSEYFENYLIQVRGFSVNTVSSYKDTFL